MPPFLPSISPPTSLCAIYVAERATKGMAFVSAKKQSSGGIPPLGSYPTALAYLFVLYNCIRYVPTKYLHWPWDCLSSCNLFFLFFKTGCFGWGIEFVEWRVSEKKYHPPYRRMRLAPYFRYLEPLPRWPSQFPQRFEAFDVIFSLRFREFPSTCAGKRVAAGFRGGRGIFFLAASAPQSRQPLGLFAQACARLRNQGIIA